ncbi:MAG: hypothetical protein IKJ83_03180 [Ruminococcus sp.]|nr:hypothetical protein [Ruminococcus sp.]
MTKRIFSIVLALVMVLAMGTVALVSVSADLAELPEQAEGTYRYYFYLPEDWKNDFTAETGNTAGVYIWEGDLLTSGWPGDPITPADFDGVYYVDCPTTTTSIIFNNYLDGGQDISEPRYPAAIQTINIGTEYYDPEENPYYPEGTENFDGMIFVTDYSQIDYSDYSHKMIIGGTWFYYYGNGEYGTSKVKGESEVMTDPHLRMDLELPYDAGDPYATTAPTEEPSSTVPTTAATTTAPTATTTTTPVEPPKGCDTDITVGETVKSACIGDTITYTMNVTAAELFENVQAVVTYDSTMLQLVRKGNDDVYEEEIACPALGDAIFNADVDGIVKFNASKVKGYNFKEGDVLVTLDFVVLAEGETAISTVIEEMTIKGDGTQSYFAGGQAVITEGITVTEELKVPVHEFPTTAPITTAPKTTVKETEVPKTTVKGTEVPKTTVGAADPDPTNVVGTTAPAGSSDPVGTGAAAYIYIAIAIMAMAACAVVVLRKKANG